MGYVFEDPENPTPQDHAEMIMSGASPEYLWYLIEESGDDAVLQCVAELGDLTEDIAWELTKQKELWMGLATNTTTPAEVLEWIAEQPETENDEHLLAEIGNNPNATERIYSRLAASKFPDVRLIAVGQVDVEITKKLCVDPDDTVRHYAQQELAGVAEQEDNRPLRLWAAIAETYVGDIEGLEQAVEELLTENPAA